MPRNANASLATGLALRIFLLAMAYIVTGRLALLLAIPPGFATAIFPPVGVGLAAVLLWGNPMLAGVLLGSTLLNLSIAWSSGGEISWRGLLVAFGIAIGSSLQNALAAALIRRFVGFPAPLHDEREVAAFLFIGAPLACIVSATWGVTVLYLAGAVPAGQYAFSWWTWWVGDGTGVLIATPLMLVFFAKPRELWSRRRRTVGLPLIISCIVMVVTFIHASRFEQDGIATHFRDRAR
ncbi:MAG TPA: MASE1 domain-containing protein, partial [Polyangium sp.]|nr:MASE1 domain-containing protein [Polyangium sp.]